MTPDEMSATLQTICDRFPDSWILSYCGITPAQQSIPILLNRYAYSHNTGASRILVISGLDTKTFDPDKAKNLLDCILSEKQHHDSNWAISVIPDANPSKTFDLSSPYPPESGFFYDKETPEARYLWRHICWQAPDLVIEILYGETDSIECNIATIESIPTLADNNQVSDGAGLLSALGTGQPDGLGPICGVRLTARPENLETQFKNVLSKLGSQNLISPASDTQDTRRSRLPLTVSAVLAKTYGHQLDPVNYTQGVGIAGRIQLHLLDPSSESPAQDITDLVEPYVSKQKDLFQNEPGGANLAGLTWAYELFQMTGDPRYKDLIIETANRYRPGSSGTAPYPCDPEFRTEDMFMAGTILGKAFEVTQHHVYIDILTQFLLDGHIQTENGLFWHCRSAPYYWGRGNGFAALGLSETLTYLPEANTSKSEIITMYQKLMQALALTQKMSGMLPQVLDFPGSYEEFTATCMFGIAMSRGLLHGWLNPECQFQLKLAWQGVNERIDKHGNIVDGCISTGVQNNVQEYLDRHAIFGPDDRSGGMALWFSLEIAKLSKSGIYLIA